MEIIGTKDKEDNVILADHWLKSSGKNMSCSLHCICLPSLEILKRGQFGWFVRLNKQQLLESNLDITKYIILSLGK